MISGLIFWLFVAGVISAIAKGIDQARAGGWKRDPRRWGGEAPSFKCQREGCGAINPSSAVYCRRCGERARGSPWFH